MFMKKNKENINHNRHKQYEVVTKHRKVSKYVKNYQSIAKRLFKTNQNHIINENTHTGQFTNTAAYRTCPNINNKNVNNLKEG